MRENYEIITIVVPVYNVQDYLPRCIESILHQSITTLEVILVDDGSTDNSGNICDEYAKRDSRIIVIHKENGGLSDARNLGISLAKGNFISFIDSDDYVDSRYVETLLKMIYQYDGDIAVISSIKVYENRIKKYLCPSQVHLIEFNNIEAIEDMWYQKHIDNSAWGKLYRMQLFENIRYPKGKLYEDLGTTYKLLYLAKKVIWSSEINYFYYQRKNSIMNTNFDVRKMDRIIISEELLKWSFENCTILIDAAISRLFISNMQVLREIPDIGQYNKEIEYIRRNIKIYRRRVIRDKNAKLLNRLIAVCSLMNIRILKEMGRIYTLICK